MKAGKLYITAVSLAVVALVVIEIARPAPVDWSHSWSRTDTAPYGAFILHEILPDLFPGTEIQTGNRPLRQVLATDGFPQKNLIFIDEQFDADEHVTEYLLATVEAGTYIFIAAASFGGVFRDSLQLSTQSYALGTIVEPLTRDRDTTSLHVAGPETEDLHAFVFNQNLVTGHFTSFDSSRAQILGHGAYGRTNFIRFEIGEGAILLSTVPLAFTNYHLLSKETAGYIFAALSHLPVRPVYWDEYYKPSARLARTPLRFILADESFSWAYYTGMSSLLLFFLFGARRRQRVIPLISPPKNTTVEFVTTIGRLHYQHGDHKSVAMKRVEYVRAYLRKYYHINVDNIDHSAVDEIAHKTRVERAVIDDLASEIQYSMREERWTDDRLRKFNHCIESFYQELQE